MTPDFPTWLPIPSPNMAPGRKLGMPVSGVVIHFTAAGSGKGSALYFSKTEVTWTETVEDSTGKKTTVTKTAKVGASAHLVIDRDGTVYQCVNFADRAWHAGPATLWKGQPIPGKNVNDWTIGIELANWGQLTENGDGSFKTYLNTPFVSRIGDDGGAAQIMAPNSRSPRAKPGTIWERFPLSQINSLIQVMKVIEHQFPSITRDDVQGHEEIQGNKSDPGPMFPWNRMLDLVFAHDAEDTVGVTDSLNAQPQEDYSGHYDEQAEQCLVDPKPDPQQ